MEFALGAIVATALIATWWWRRARGGTTYRAIEMRYVEVRTPQHPQSSATPAALPETTPAPRKKEARDRIVRAKRCSACDAAIRGDAYSCPKCGALAN